MNGWMRRLGLVLLFALWAFPLYWMLVASVTPEAGLFGAPSIVPSQPIGDHYGALFSQHIRQADEGCDSDFLEGTMATPEPEIH